MVFQSLSYVSLLSQQIDKNVIDWKYLLVYYASINLGQIRRFCAVNIKSSSLNEQQDIIILTFFVQSSLV